MVFTLPLPSEEEYMLGGTLEEEGMDEVGAIVEVVDFPVKGVGCREGGTEGFNTDD